MIDIIIPTMWMSEDFNTALTVYVNHPLVNKVIIIDNNRKARPNLDILYNKKIELISYGKNIYVNPAWNEGYLKSTSKIMSFINDDITVSADVIDMICEFNFQEGDLVGVNLRGYQNNYKIDDHIDTNEEIVKLNYDPNKPIGSQAWAFGICMFMLRSSFRAIPSLYQVWYGDDYLAQYSKTVFSINSNKIKGKISETLKRFDDPDSAVSKRIELDSKNLLRFNHFKNSKNWDIPHNIIKSYESQRSSKLDSTIFEKEYNWAKTTPSDINENIELLHTLAKECKTVVEMGVRTGVSTRAFLNSDVSLRSYDVVLYPKVQALFEIANKLSKDAKYIKQDVLTLELEECDMLFIDTLHTYAQLTKELTMHGNKATRYLVFHDTHTFGLRDEVGDGKKGLLTAIIEFMIKNPQWKFKTHTTINNGMTILTRA